MNVLDSALSAGSAGVVEQLASQFHINADQAGSAISALLPAIAGGLKERLATRRRVNAIEPHQRRQPE